MSTKKNISYVKNIQYSPYTLISIFSTSQYSNRNENEVCKCILLVVENIPLEHQEREHHC